MQKTPFIWLGSRRAKRQGAGMAGRLLDKAAGAGLPVPPGAILLDTFYQLLLAEKVIVLQEDAVVVPDPSFLQETLYDAVRFPRLDGFVVVRAATEYAADSFALGAGVNFSDPVQLSESLCEAWSVNSDRKDVLVMERVAGEVWGTAVTTHTSANDTINYRGETAKSTLALPKLRPWQSPAPEHPAFAQRLQKLLRGLRRTFGRHKSWQVQWIDDGQICWLVQIQPALDDKTDRSEDQSA